jgi:2'-5' RNA ligase
MKVNFALLLPDEIATECVRLSHEIASTYKSLVELGPRSLAHITVLQTHCEESEIDHLWQRAVGVMHKSYQVTFAGLTLLPSNEGQCWLEIQVLKTGALLEIQDALLGIAAADGREVFNGTGDNYRPHVTVGLLPNNHISAGMPIPLPLLRETKIPTVPSLGLVGDNFIYLEPIRMLHE